MSARRAEMYQELDDYLAARRKTTAQPEPQPKRGWFSKKKEEPPMETAQETNEYEQKKEGWWSRFKKSRKQETEELNEQPEEPMQEFEAPQTNQTEEDMKEVARIALTVLRKMTPEQTREFKTTQDYEKFKDILRKYKMIK